MKEVKCTISQLFAWWNPAHYVHQLCTLPDGQPFLGTSFWQPVTPQFIWRCKKLKIAKAILKKYKSVDLNYQKPRLIVKLYPYNVILHSKNVVMCHQDVPPRSSFQNIFFIYRRTWKRNFLSFQCSEILIPLSDNLFFSALFFSFFKSCPGIYSPVTSHAVNSFHLSTSFRICLNCKEFLCLWSALPRAAHPWGLKETGVDMLSHFSSTQDTLMGNIHLMLCQVCITVQLLSRPHGFSGL